MSSHLKKAQEAVRKSFRAKRYEVFDAKENNYIDSPARERRVRRSTTTSLDTTPPFAPAAYSRLDGKQQNQKNPEGDKTNEPNQANETKQSLNRASSVSQSMREAVGTIRQKLKMSTRRRAKLQVTPTRAGKRRQSMGGRDVKMSSPFKIDTPSRRNGIKTSLSVETPTRLRREVEDLTANMQALSALTPNTLRSRRVQPLTNGSLKAKSPQAPPRASRRRATEIY